MHFFGVEIDHVFISSLGGGPLACVARSLVDYVISCVSESENEPEYPDGGTNRPSGNPLGKDISFDLTNSNNVVT